METKLTLQLIDIQQIAENAGRKISKSEAKQILNTYFSEICNAHEEIISRAVVENIA